MIRVKSAKEPSSFDESVRLPGLEALARRVGVTEIDGKKLRGRPPKHVYARREEIPSDDFPPLWRQAIPDLRREYRNLCAYTALYIEHGTGDATVDHFTPISSDWRGAYEWSNYRLACGQVNTNKDVRKPLDPFEIEDGWFALELVGYQVVPGADTTGALRDAIAATINNSLRLNQPRFISQRSAEAEAYLAGDVALAHLERRAPFVARELRRQGMLRAADRAE